MRIDCKNREAWLDCRQFSIGASDSPILYGEGYGEACPLSLYGEKTGLIPPTKEPSEEMEVGLAVQPVISELFANRSGIRVIKTPPYEVCIADDHHHITATLDGKVLDGDEQGVLELKNVGEWSAKEWAADEPPLRVQIQNQQQLLCSEFNFGYSVALLGGNRLVWRRFERYQRFIDALIDRVSFFWTRIIELDPPPPDDSAAYAAALRKLYPKDDGEEIVLPAEAQQWDNSLAGAKRCIHLHEETKQLAENKLRAAMGSAVRGVLPGGGAYTLKTIDRKAYKVQPTTYRQLRREKE